MRYGKRLKEKNNFMETNIDLNGKWNYSENYGYGMAKGELHIKQEGDSIEGRIIFTDTVFGEQSFMIQEFLEGKIEDDKLFLQAVDFDIIHSDIEISYELDSWEGDIISNNLIQGKSFDDQGIEGNFEFRRDTDFMTH